MKGYLSPRCFLVIQKSLPSQGDRNKHCLTSAVQLYDNVLGWWFLCALKRNCIAPTTMRGCQFHGNRSYGNCHRFDQSAINILLANYFVDEHPAYMFYSARRGGAVLAVMRGSAHEHRVFDCKSDVQMKARDYFEERRAPHIANQRNSTRPVSSNVNVSRSVSIS